MSFHNDMSFYSCVYLTALAAEHSTEPAALSRLKAASAACLRLSPSLVFVMSMDAAVESAAGQPIVA